MTAPPVLTAERIDAMLSIMAEVCLEGVIEAGARQKAAPEMDDFERAARSLNTACRNLRQTIAIKQRFDREEAAKAQDARKAVEADRQEAEQAREQAVQRKYAGLRRHFGRLLWDEYEDDDAQERFDDLDERLSDLTDADDFLETPVETLIQQLADKIGLGERADESSDADPPSASPSGGKRREAPQGRVADGGSETAEDADPPKPETPPIGHSASPSGRFPPEGETASPPAVEPEPPEPPPRPPDPPPEEGYVPPWERLKPGQYIRGGSGW